LFFGKAKPKGTGKMYFVATPYLWENVADRLDQARAQQEFLDGNYSFAGLQLLWSSVAALGNEGNGTKRLLPNSVCYKCASAYQPRRENMKLIVSLLTAFFVSGAALAATAEEDVTKYTAIFNGDAAWHNNAVESLAWMGISDTRLYDVIEQRLLKEAPIAKGNNDEKNRVARYIRALGFSGQDKYFTTISRLVADRVYERYAQQALKELPQYKNWNPIISNRATFDPKYSDDVNRVANMLRSNDLQLKKIGAKRVYFAHKDDVLLDLLSKDMLRIYPIVTDDEDVDTAAWLVKALGSAKDPKYRAAIQEVASKARNTKIQQYAKKALEP
jgi:hypothetical protein